ncbi:MAG TPA: DinB family protein [Cyclobacteriaceae bacterium]|jgi:uncharacterized damage-inducible protein DinB|nr:DinB family protein [Cyclobacteriaceae bacterium]
MSAQQTKWFDRKFDFSAEQNIFPSIIERLRGAPARLEEKIQGVAENILTAKVDGAWSIKENVGHLIDLEPLWMGRLEDILNKETFLRTADLSNTKTHQANHNAISLKGLLETFRSDRQLTVRRLELLTEKEIYLSALHPRLKTPMRMMDHFLFVAEHDDHHLATITQIIQTFH